MNRTRYTSHIAITLIVFASLAAGIAGCESTNCHKEGEECASGAAGHGGEQGQGGAGGNSSDAGTD